MMIFQPFTCAYHIFQFEECVKKMIWASINISSLIKIFIFTFFCLFSHPFFFIKLYKTTTKKALPAALGQWHQNGLLIMGVLSKARVKNRSIDGIECDDWYLHFSPRLVCFIKCDCCVFIKTFADFFCRFDELFLKNTIFHLLLCKI